MKQLYILQETDSQFITETKVLFKQYYNRSLKDIDAVEIIDNVIKLVFVLNDIKRKHRNDKGNNY